MNFFNFFNELIKNPILLIAAILIIFTIIMNGAIDAPNAIATSVSTRALYINNAFYISTIGNFLGVLVVSLINARVAHTIFNMVDFTSKGFLGSRALVAALLGIILWGIITWKFNIPTSSSHSLVAGLCGASIALNGGMKGINTFGILMVFYGIIISIVVAYFLGSFIVKIIKNIFKKRDRRDSKRFFDRGQIVSATLMSFIHGAQDGQKFIAIFMILTTLMGHNPENEKILPLWILIISAIAMGIGTSIGIKRVIKSIGMDVVSLETYEGFSADIASFISILIATILGIPLSTTQTSTTSIMGVGATKRKSNVNWAYAKYLSVTWFLTFPICGLLCYLLTKLFMLF